jgi:hypothetical protein
MCHACRVPFVYVYIVVIYASWLLRRQYKVPRSLCHSTKLCCHRESMFVQPSTLHLFKVIRNSQDYVRLRQRYIVQGEVSVNEWHDHFMLQGARRTTLNPDKPLPPPSSAQRASIQSIVQHWTGLSRRRHEVLLCRVSLQSSGSLTSEEVTPTEAS